MIRQIMKCTLVKHMLANRNIKKKKTNQKIYLYMDAIYILNISI